MTDHKLSAEVRKINKYMHRKGIDAKYTNDIKLGITVKSMKKFIKKNKKFLQGVAERINENVKL